MGKNEKREYVLILKGKKVEWAKRFPINVNEGLSQKVFFSFFSIKQEVRH